MTNTFEEAYRNLGDEEHLHNVNGLIEQIAYANAMSASENPLFSDSTSMGSGKLGFVGKMFDGGYLIND